MMKKMFKDSYWQFEKDSDRGLGERAESLSEFIHSVLF